MPSALLTLVYALSNVQGRVDAVAQLAQHVGATSIHVFVRDVDLGILLSAPGMPQTVPDHPSWNALLAACEEAGVHRADVLDVASGTVAPATAYVGEDGTVVALVGASSATLDPADLALPLLGALFRAEQRAGAATGEAHASKEAARHASALTAALERSRVDLERVVQAKRELLREHEMLLGIVGHDLRSPLNSVVMGTALLLEHSELPPAQVKILLRVKSSSLRMARMIADLLDFERSRQGGIPIVRTSVALRGVVAQVVDEMDLIHPTRTIEFSENGEAMGRWDADRFAQVASNLIGNAIQHSPPNTTVGVSLTETRDTIVIEVSNEHASPILADDLGRLFEPFRRGEQSTGLGLGLFIVKQIADAHGGSVTAVSLANRTSVTVTLPRTNAS